MSDKPIYGPLAYALIMGTVTILAAWGVTDGSLGDDRSQCGGYNAQEAERAVAGDTGGQDDNAEPQAEVLK